MIRRCEAKAVRSHLQRETGRSVPVCLTIAGSFGTWGLIAALAAPGAAGAADAPPPPALSFAVREALDFWGGAGLVTLNKLQLSGTVEGRYVGLDGW